MMSEGNGYATPGSVFGSAFKRRYLDHEQVFNGERRKFRLQTLNDKEKGAIEAEAVNSKGMFRRDSVKTYNARLIVAAWVDATGQRVCTSRHVETIQEYDSAEVQELADAIKAHCCWDGEPAKNSVTTDADALPTS